MLEHTNTLPTRLTLPRLQEMADQSKQLWDELEEKIPKLTDLVHFHCHTEEVAMQLIDPDAPDQDGEQLGYDVRVGVLTVVEALGWEYVARQLEDDPQAFLIGATNTYQDRMCWIDVEGQVNPMALLAQYIAAHGCASGILRHVRIDMEHADDDEPESEYDYHDPLEMTRDVFRVFEQIDLPQHYATTVAEILHQEIAEQERVVLNPTIH